MIPFFWSFSYYDRFLKRRKFFFSVPTIQWEKSFVHRPSSKKWTVAHKKRRKKIWNRNISLRQFYKLRKVVFHCI